jgi:hypothetical protein
MDPELLIRSAFQTCFAVKFAEQNSQFTPWVNIRQLTGVQIHENLVLFELRNSCNSIKRT